ncbi:MAG: 16S rRNA (guanine(527)-N(7))-methyltransferase RsmG [Treponema sp.]|nr:16S rRNA (guanine(527)-N(7))-methyltransferase RsmG [Treponema sp.]
MTQKLHDGVKKLELDMSPVQMDALETYIQLVLECNKTYNLIRAATAEDVAVNHVLDSLAAAKEIKSIAVELSEKNSISPLIADIGSGGGCPGIPLAVFMPEFQFVLVERMERRCRFLENAVSQMHLENVRVECVQADLLEPKSIDIEVFRAFHPFEKKIAGLLLDKLKKGGYIACYKARTEKITAEMESVKQQIPSYKKIPLTVPYIEDHERNLVVIKK